ncbi:transposable element Tc1 transposase [Trichonephila clavipes]|nr:transposable element Tc1 transposase [Trichonephila clavipes]
MIERNLRSYQLLRNLPLTSARCRARLQWCLARSGWNHADWGRIVFSDESHFQLCPGNHRRRVWRRLGQRADPSFTIACHTSPQLGVMVWGAISFDSRTLLGTIRGTLTAQRLSVPGNVDHLARKLEKIWQETPRETIRVPYDSVPRSVAACIQARGEATPY